MLAIVLLLTVLTFVLELYCRSFQNLTKVEQTFQATAFARDTLEEVRVWAKDPVHFSQPTDDAIDIMRVITRAASPKTALKLLQKHVPELSSLDLEPILKRDDRMDMFVHLLSLLGQKGYKVPISEVHWIMAMHHHGRPTLTVQGRKRW